MNSDQLETKTLMNATEQLDTLLATDNLIKEYRHRRVVNGVSI